jgi:hypothetical protein
LILWRTRHDSNVRALPSEFCAWQLADTGVRLISITLELGNW